MTFFDLILLLALFGFIWFGFWNGLVHALGGLISIILSVFVASRWYDVLALKLLPFLDNNASLANLLGFIIIFALAQIVFMSIVQIVNKFFQMPFLKIINRLAGAVFGLVGGVLIIGLILYFSTKFSLGSGWEDLINTSFIAPTLIVFGKLLLPLIPEAIKQIKSLI